MSDLPDQLLSEYLSSAGTETPSRAVLEKSVYCLLDAVSLAVAARNHPVTVAVESVCSPVSKGGASSWGSGTRMSVHDSFLVNGTASHGFFQDDTDMVAWAHPASLIVPVATGLAESGGRPLGDALRGLIAGYATLTWLGANEAVSRQLVDRGFRASPTLGTIAAAAAGAVTLGLTQREALSAIGIAADSTGGLLEPVRDGAQDWRLQNGFAAQRGGLAAILAQRGVVGPSLPLTGPRAFLSTFTNGEIPDGWTVTPRGESILDVWFKPYPTLGDNMAPVVAAAALTTSMPPVAQVERVVIHMNAHFASYPGTQFMGPFERTEQMIASTAFAVATLLLRGSLSYDDYEELLHDRNVLDLVARTEIVAEHDFGYLQGTVEVHTSTRTLVSSTEDIPSEVFFRDRATTLQVLERRHGVGAPAVTQQIFDWLDGSAPEPSTSEVVDNLQAWRG